MKIVKLSDETCRLIEEANEIDRAARELDAEFKRLPEYAAFQAAAVDGGVPAYCPAAVALQMLEITSRCRRADGDRDAAVKRAWAALRADIGVVWSMYYEHY
jgi:hypothetical protein